MLFKIVNGSVTYDANTVLSEIEFEIKDKEKIAIVGRNGCGKTTLLKAVIGEVPLDEGTGEDSFNVIKAGNPSIGYLKQNAFADGSVTLLDEILKVYKPITDLENKINELSKKMETEQSDTVIKQYSKAVEDFEFLGGYTYKKEYTTAIKVFGFSDSDKGKTLCEFSGGQRTKIAFLKLLLSKPDILLLDEPTNHLDIEAIEWLETYLKNYKSSVVIVSHDRMFLDRIVNVVYEIEYGETKRYTGKYSDFEKTKRENYDKQLSDHEAQRAEINRLMAVVERFRYKATKASMAQAKLKQIERMKIIDAPNRYDLRTFHANFKPDTESVKNVLSVRDLKIGYDNVLSTVNFELFRGEKLGVIGRNGIGKSTLLKTLVNKVSSLGGSFSLGVKVSIGYFDQQMASYTSDKTVLDEFHDEFPRLTEKEVRNSLGAFMFSGEDVFKKVETLSGGEKVRLALCKILKKKPNFLILDEPTNHMDIIGKETLESMLKEYTGTLMFVSHDRYFVNKVADRLLVFDYDGVKYYPCGFDEYERVYKKPSDLTETSKIKENEKSVKKTFTTPLKEISKRQNRIKRLEQLVFECDEKLKDLNEKFSSPEVYSDYVKVNELQTEIDKYLKEENSYTEEWMTLSNELEKLLCQQEK